MSENHYFGTYGNLDESDFEIDDNPEFVAYMDYLCENLDEWRKKSKISAIHPKKYNDFRNAFVSLNRLFVKENPQSEISYKLDNETGNASVTIVSYSIDIDDVKTFVDGIRDSYGISFMGSDQQGKIVIDISFHVCEYLYIEPDRE
jgi:hypothetical protein